MECCGIDALRCLFEDAFLQFVDRGICEGQKKDLFRLGLLRHQKLFDKTYDGRGLSCSCPRYDQTGVDIHGDGAELLSVQIPAFHRIDHATDID